MSDAPLVSVVIATRNRAAFLPAAVQSAWAAAADLATEVIVVDDASTDATPQLCAQWPAVRVVHSARQVGLAAARNLGIRAARGEFIALLDDDDLRLPDSLRGLVRALEKETDAAFAYAQMQLADGRTGALTGHIRPRSCPSGDIFWELLRGNFVPVLSTLVRRAALFDAGLFDEALTVVEDWDLWLRLSERHPVAALAEPAAIYRQASSSTGQLSSNGARMWRTAVRVQARALALPRATAAPRSQAREVRQAFLATAARQLVLSATKDLLASSFPEARKRLLAAVAIAPRAAWRLPDFSRVLYFAFAHRGEISERRWRELKRLCQRLRAA